MKKYLLNRIRSFKAASAGLTTLLVEEPHGLLHLLAACLSLGISYYLGISKLEFIIIILLIALVFACELINSAIERIVDLVKPEYHILAGKAKDFAAAAVLIVAIAAAIIGLYIWSGYINLP